MIDGEVTVQSLKTRNKAEAQAFEALWRADHLRGEHGLLKPPTLSAFATRFLNYQPGKVRPSSYTAYISRFKSLLDYGPLAECTLDRIDDELIEAFRRSQPVKISTVNARLRTLRRALRLAQEWGLIRKVPKIRIPTGQEHQREYVLSEAVLQQFLDRAQTEMHRALWAILFDTGLRIGEACSLTWADIEGTPPVAVHVRKGKTKYARRRVPVTKRASDVLESIRRGSGPVFHRHGRAINQPWANHPFTAIRKELGLPSDCVLHSLRHSYLTRLGNAGVSPFVLQRLAGHSNIALTARYSHPDDEQLDRAIALLD